MFFSIPIMATPDGVVLAGGHKCDSIPFQTAHPYLHNVSSARWAPLQSAAHLHSRWVPNHHSQFAFTLAAPAGYSLCRL